MKKHYSSSVTFMILGDQVDPELISAEIGLKPDQSWKRGENKEFNGKIFRSKHKWGGWKKFIGKNYEKSTLEKQLEFWLDKLESKSLRFKKYKRNNYLCLLDCTLSVSDAEMFILDSEMIKRINKLGLEIRFTIL